MTSKTNLRHISDVKQRGLKDQLQENSLLYPQLSMLTRLLIRILIEMVIGKVEKSAARKNHYNNI